MKRLRVWWRGDRCIRLPWPDTWWSLRRKHDPYWLQDAATRIAAAYRAFERGNPDWRHEDHDAAST